jgi:hypothetical protein
MTVCTMMDNYLHEGGNASERLETFLTSSAAESIIGKLNPPDLAAFEGLVSDCLRVEGANVVVGDRLEKTFACLTVRDFLRFENRYFKRAALR